jgi:hypothetical protein
MEIGVVGVPTHAAPQHVEEDSKSGLASATIQSLGQEEGLARVTSKQSSFAMKRILVDQVGNW